MPRKKFVAGNWKMNPTTLAESVALARAVVADATAVPQVDVGVFPPFVWLPAVGEVVMGSAVALGAQNVYAENKGAFTGEVSPPMVKELGCGFVIIGHSERRQLLGESDAAVNLKMHAAIEAGLTVFVCIGETERERKMNLTHRILERQVFAATAGLSDAQLSQVRIAYEPIWAIGTGVTATPEQAQDAHVYVRARFARLHGEKLADQLPILYGGSVTPETAAGLFACPDIDGGLVGGASLKADQFGKIIRAAAG